MLIAVHLARARLRCFLAAGNPVVDGPADEDLGAFLPIKVVRSIIGLSGPINSPAKPRCLAYSTFERDKTRRPWRPR